MTREARKLARLARLVRRRNQAEVKFIRAQRQLADFLRRQRGSYGAYPPRLRQGERDAGLRVLGQ